MRIPWNVYSNPKNPKFISVNVLVIYIFLDPQHLMGHHRKLFPCYDQYSRYIKEFIDIIKEHEDYLCQEYCSHG